MGEGGAVMHDEKKRFWGFFGIWNGRINLANTAIPHMDMERETWETKKSTFGMRRLA